MIDLHIHTICSDGKKKPEEILKFYYDAGYRTIAITDHETIEGYKIATQYNPYGDLIIIPGVELETMYFDQKIHVLAYMFHADSEQVNTFINQIKSHRKMEAIQLLRKLRSFDCDLYKKIKKDTNISINAIIQNMVIDGYGDTKQDIIDKLFCEGGPLYIKEYIPIVEDITSNITSAGGFVSLAHPFRITQEKSEIIHLVEYLKEKGVSGIECYHPSHSKENIKFCIELAKQNQLKITGGSDYHRGSIISSFYDLKNTF